MSQPNQSRADSLIERLGGFAYDYQMHCACGRTSRVPADVYWERESIDALAPCEHCGQDIHYGPAVAALRDPNDLALSNDMVAGLAWYHTSTFRDWPSPEYAALVGARLRKVGDILPSHIRDRELVKALHVGTYESAIENMLRRMHDQDDADSGFYLHRISLDLTPSDINVGFRDENHEDASQLSLEEMGGLLAVRYVNVHEASGSISLAIHPAAIHTIQTIALPPTGLAPAPPANVIEGVARIEEELAAARAAMPDTSGIDPYDLRIRVLKARSSGDDVALRVRECGERRYRAWDELKQVLAEAYLVGVNPVVRDAFVDAMHAPAPGTASAYHDHFRAHSAALTRAEDVVAQLRRQPVRRVADQN
ncbi:hypothetical protein A5660_25080 [Mycobacterium alsense]|uniref:hypothetical protein n=1 Tax=Mycobacterium alsense TaxID=324058 RepID=UPI000801AEC6|nr:hypothetical protein [Mycobacterium alsense]OBJ00369.1 hypothetical protein A5660_25080 [Mycobacterium alsense]